MTWLNSVLVVGYALFVLWLVVRLTTDFVTLHEEARQPVSGGIEPEHPWPRK